MTTTVKPQTAPADVDLDTRLTLAAAGMDAIIEHKYPTVISESQEAMYAAVREARTTLPVFESHPILKAAGDLIRSHGWQQGTYGSRSLGYCAIGAIRTVTYGPDWGVNDRDGRDQDAIEELLNRIASDTGTPQTVPNWNDHKGRTREDVLRLLY
jgi:hypothetical protein